MKKCCPRNTRSTPMKQNLRDKAFVAFVCLVGKPLLPKIVVGNHRPKKSSQSAMNLAYSSADAADGRNCRACASLARGLGQETRITAMVTNPMTAASIGSGQSAPV